MSTLMKKISSGMLIATLAIAMGACSSKKKAEDTSITGDGSGAPAIDSQAMNFDASGSDSGNIAGLQSINFEYDRATLSASAKKIVQGNADWVKKNNASVQIEGHCDSRGSIEYNLSLGERRAQAVKSYMTTLGVPAAKLSIISYGKEKPLVSGDSESAYTANRRANFLPLSQ